MRWLLIIAIAVFFCGCIKTKPRVNAAKPVEHIITVRADLPWQNSGIRVKDGQIIKCKASGEWRDHFASYGPEGNADLYKNHFRVSAPANSLIMQISSQTNISHFIGRQTNIVAERSGEIRFRKNYSLPVGMEGTVTVRVKVCSDADGDHLADYDEINIWKTDPLNRDSDGDGFDDYEEASDLSNQMKGLTEERRQ
jgi:hypothetical protein